MKKTVRTTLTSRFRTQRGALLVIYAAMIIGLVGFAGLAVDVGYLQYTKRRIQMAADAAAMGALRELELGHTDLTAAGQNDASLNGFTDGASNTTVTINNPPASGTYLGETTAVQAIVTRVVPTYFMRVFGQNSVTVSAQAVGQTSTSYGSVGGCIFVLDPTASGAFTIDGTAGLTTACGAMVNSNSSQAFTMVGTSNAAMVSGAEIGVVGPGTTGEGWSLSGGATITNSTTGKSESPINIQSFADPLANVSAPTASGMSVITTSGGESVKPNTTVTLQPGIYCGGMDLKGTVTFSAGSGSGGGIYVLAGGGLTVNSQATLSGSNVMFYNTSSSFSSSCTKGSSSDTGSFTFNGGATINLVGLTSNGMLFFDDRTVTGLSHTINGNSTTTYDGAMYFKNAYVKFAGTNRTPGFMYLVTDTLELTGTSNLGNDKSSLESVYTLAPTSTGGGLVQ